MNSVKRVAFYTLGCKVNQYETESIKKQLTDMGYEEVDFTEAAELYIVNSCTVTSIADRKTRNILRRAKKSNENALVIATGCYAQTNAGDLEEIEEIDYVIGNSDKGAILNLVKTIEDGGDVERTLHRNIFDANEYEELEFSTLREMTRAYIKIQDGCNNFCSYCKIPFARGKSRSRRIDSVVEESRKLAAEGFKELIIIGINLGAYGEDLDEGMNFEDLLREISKVDGIERIRIGSMYPDKITDEFIEQMRTNAKLMPHLHISLQSCDDKVLEGMKRKYDSSVIRDRLLKLKAAVPEMEYTADVIVGFPGENEEGFKNTCDVIEEIGFSDLHIFQYSDRENTVASKLPGKVSPSVKKERAKALEEVELKMFETNTKTYVGKTVKVLVEESKHGKSYGYTENYLRTEVADYVGQANEIIEVEINQLKKGMLSGVKK